MLTSSAAAHVDPSARVLTVSSAVLRAQLGALVMFVVVGMCVVSSLLGHVSVMTSEALARAGSRGRLVVLEAAMRGGKRSGRSLVSMVLTSIPHRRCTPKKNRRIPTIPTGNIDSRLVHVSTVDTGPRRNESGALGGTARRLRHRSAPPPARCLRGARSKVGPSRSRIWPRPLPPAQGPGGHGSTPALP